MHVWSNGANKGNDEIITPVLPPKDTFYYASLNQQLTTLHTQHILLCNSNYINCKQCISIKFRKKI